MEEDPLEDFKAYWQGIESINDFYSALNNTKPDDLPPDVWYLLAKARDAIRELDEVLWDT